jgi:hypothetical protein
MTHGPWRRLVLLVGLLLAIRAIAAIRYMFKYDSHRVLADAAAVLIYGYLLWSILQGRRWAGWSLLVIAIITVVGSVRGLSFLTALWRGGEADAIVIWLSLPILHLFVLYELIRSGYLSKRAAA